MVGRNFIVKNAKSFFAHTMQQIFLENFLPLPRNRLKNEMISFG